MTDKAEQALSDALIPLLSGVVERERKPRAWQALMHRTAAVIDYLATIHLELVINDSDGYAFLRQREPDESEGPSLPRLVARRPLSARVSLLLVQLRKRMLEHDAGGGEARLMISREEIAESLRVYLPESTDEARLAKAIDTAINGVVKLGFMAALKGSPDNFEVRPVIKSMIDADWLNDYQQQLTRYLADARDGS